MEKGDPSGNRQTEAFHAGFMKRWLESLRDVIAGQDGTLIGYHNVESAIVAAGKGNMDRPARAPGPCGAGDKCHQRPADAGRVAAQFDILDDIDNDHNIRLLGHRAAEFHGDFRQFRRIDLLLDQVEVVGVDARHVADIGNEGRQLAAAVQHQLMMRAALVLGQIAGGR